MAAKYLFGSDAGGLFKRCPHDPTVVHPFAPHEHPNSWPDGPSFVKQAGCLAGPALPVLCAAFICSMQPVLLHFVVCT